MTVNYPVLGVGAGNFPDRYREFTQIWRFRIPRDHAHSAYIEVAAQSGVVGLISYVAIIVVVGSHLRQGLLKARDPASRAVVVGAIGVSLAFAIHNAFDYLHVVNLPIQLVVFWALAATVGRGALLPENPGPSVQGDRPVPAGYP
jgi:O-antigen ligase